MTEQLIRQRRLQKVLQQQFKTGFTGVITIAMRDGIPESLNAEPQQKTTTEDFSKPPAGFKGDPNNHAEVWEWLNS